jgi:D-alanyl-D-alanine dipeptidase
VDDPASERYNELRFRPAEGPPPWASAEEMRRSDEAYRWGVVVEHNTGWQRVAGGGSCIFLHVWSGPASPTVGCTAMEADRLVEVMRWLDASRTPVLVQLPDAVYQRLRTTWELP